MMKPQTVGFSLPAPPALEPVAFGLRLWVSVCLALLIAFWLQLDNPFWAGTSAGIVCQPSLGASMRKATFRLIGTLLGATAVVVMFALFPQSRWGLILVLASWCGICGFAATVLRNFASYAGALSGYTAVIIAADAIADPNSVFLLAVARASEICLGIVCAGLVMILTERGTARARAASIIATITREIGVGMRATLMGAGSPPVDTAPKRRELIGRATGLATLLDETVGESADLRVRSGTLQAAVDGLFSALSGWRMVATHVESTEPAQAAVDASAAVAGIPAGPAIVMTAESSPAETRDLCLEAARRLAGRSANEPGAALVLAGSIQALVGLARALNGVALLMEPERAEIVTQHAVLRHPDLLPAILNGIRSFLIILVIAALWIITAWPSGPVAMIFGAIIVLLLSPRGDAAITSAWEFLAGTIFTAGLAAVADFALLPGLEGFPRLALIMGMFLVPLAALSRRQWHPSFFVAAATNFTPLLAPSNLPSYDTAAFYNSTVAIGVGVGVGVLVMTLLPQLSPEHRANRLLMLTLRDLRRLTTRRRPGTPRQWEALMYGRLSVLPPSASPLARAELTAALFVGEAILRLRQQARQWGDSPAVERVLSALRQADPDAAVRALAQADAAVARTKASPLQQTGARAAILALSEVLTRHAVYFRQGRNADALR